MKMLKDLKHKFLIWRSRRNVRKVLKLLVNMDKTFAELGYSRKHRKNIWRDFIYQSDKAHFIKTLIGDDKL